MNVKPEQLTRSLIEIDKWRLDHAAFKNRSSQRESLATQKKSSQTYQSFIKNGSVSWSDLRQCLEMDD